MTKPEPYTPPKKPSSIPSILFGSTLGFIAGISILTALLLLII